LDSHLPFICSAPELKNVGTTLIIFEDRRRDLPKNESVINGALYRSNKSAAGKPQSSERFKKRTAVDFVDSFFDDRCLALLNEYIFFFSSSSIFSSSSSPVNHVFPSYNICTYRL
jgi:hypothetical protein